MLKLPRHFLCKRLVSLALQEGEYLKGSPEGPDLAFGRVGTEPRGPAPRHPAVAPRRNVVPGHRHLDEPHGRRHLPHHEAAPVVGPTSGGVVVGHHHPDPPGRKHALRAARDPVAPGRRPELPDYVLGRRRHGLLKSNKRVRFLAVVG